MSRRIRVTNIMICDQCGTQEAIEDFVVNASSYGLDSVVTVPAGKNGTGYESEPYDESGEKSPTVSTDLDSHSRNADDIDLQDSNRKSSVADSNRTSEGENEESERKEKLIVNVLPLKDWYIVKIWTGTFSPEEVENGKDSREVASK